MTTHPNWPLAAIAAAVLTAFIVVEIVWALGQVPTSALPERRRG